MLRQPRLAYSVSVGLGDVKSHCGDWGRKKAPRNLQGAFRVGGRQGGNLSSLLMRGRSEAEAANYKFKCNTECAKVKTPSFFTRTIRTATRQLRRGRTTGGLMEETYKDPRIRSRGGHVPKGLE